MTRKNRNLLILGVLLIALCGSYVGILKYKEYSQQKAEEVQKAEEEANKITLNSMDAVARVTLNNAGEEIAFVKQDDQWVYENDPEFPLNTDMVTSIENNLNPLEAARKLEEKEELSIYGLAEPAKTITVTDQSGNSKVILIGNKNDYSQDYYVMVQGEEEVYTIGTDLITAIDHPLNDFVRLDTIPYLTEDMLTSITATDDTQTISYQKKEQAEPETVQETETQGTAEEESASSQPETAETVSEIVWQQKTGDQLSELEDSSALQNAINTISSLNIDSCENYHASVEQLAQYGLDEASRKALIIEYTEDGEAKTAVLQIGNKDESQESYYIRIGDSKQVNKVGASSIDSILPVLLPGEN